jgi:hypothetical protein
MFSSTELELTFVRVSEWSSAILCCVQDKQSKSSFATAASAILLRTHLAVPYALFPTECAAEAFAPPSRFQREYSWRVSHLSTFANADVLFISRCWDGKSVDSANHKSHVVYPSSGSFESTGPCLDAHLVRLPQVMYKVMWDTREFNDRDLWLVNGSNPFVYSMGDL